MAAPVISLKIATVERKGLLAPSTLKIQQDLNSRSTGSFQFNDKAGTYRPLVGEPVELRIDAAKIFAGTIERFQETQPTGTVGRILTIDVVDNSQLADRHIVAKIYENQTLKQIVQDIVTDHLTVEGVTLDAAFPTGQTFVFMPFNYVSAAAAFDDLSKIGGFAWFIDFDKVLFFCDCTTNEAPSDLDDAAKIWLPDSLSVERTRERYRNVQILRGGVTITDAALVEPFKGDGETRTFLTSLPVAQSPTVKVNAAAKTVGIRQVETGKDWYWQENSNQISQDSGGTVLTTSDTLEVTFFGFFPLITKIRDQIGVNDRITVEGGSGIYEQIEDEQDIVRIDLGRDRGFGLLRRFGAIEEIVTFATRVTGWLAGQFLEVNLTAQGIGGPDVAWIVAGVTFEEREFQDFVYNIRAVSGEAVESWIDFWKKVADLQGRRSLRDTDVVNLIRTFPELITIAELATQTTEASREYQWNRSPTEDEWGLSQWTG